MAEVFNGSRDDLRRNVLQSLDEGRFFQVSVPSDPIIALDYTDEIISALRENGIPYYCGSMELQESGLKDSYLLTVVPYGHSDR